MAEYKKTGKCKALIAPDVWHSATRETSMRSEVDQVLGTTTMKKLWEAVDEALQAAGVEEKPLSYLPQTDAHETTGGHYAYLKIAEGCTSAVPIVSSPKLRDVTAFGSDGAADRAGEGASLHRSEGLIRCKAETTVYGGSVREKVTASASGANARSVGCVDPDFIAIRRRFTEDLIQTMKREEKICHLSDLPIRQHMHPMPCSDAGRRTTRA